MIKKNGTASYSGIYHCRLKNTTFKTQLAYLAQGQYQLILKYTSQNPPKFVNTYNTLGQLLQQIAVTYGTKIITLNQQNGGFVIVKYKNGEKEVINLNLP